MTVAFVLLLTIPVALGIALSARGRVRRAPVASRAERIEMYRTSFGFVMPAGADAAPARRHTPAVFVASIVPFAAGGILAAFAAPHQVKQLWLFSCRLFGH